MGRGARLFGVIVIGLFLIFVGATELVRIFVEEQ